MALLLGALSLPVFAAEPSDELARSVQPEQGLDQAVIDEIGPYAGAVDGFGARLLELLRRTLAKLPELGLREGLRTLALVLAAALFCAVLEQGEKARATTPLIGALAIAAACVRPFDSMIALGTAAIRELQTYMGLLLPGMAGLMAASGSVSGAGLPLTGALLLELLLGAVSELLVPLLLLFLVLAVAESALGLEQLGRLRDFVKWLLVSGVKGLMWAYSAVLALTGIISGAVDGQKLRTLRAAVAGLIPVVGNLVSEASASLLSAASLLRTGVGLYGMLAVFGICLGPFLRLAVHFLLLKLAAALCALVGKGSQSALLEKLHQAMGLMLALTGIACLLALMILVLCIRTVIP